MAVGWFLALYLYNIVMQNRFTNRYRPLLSVL